MAELPDLQRFCSQFLRQWDVLQKHMDAELKTAQECYSRNFNITVQSTSQLYSGQHIFVDRPQAQMTEPEQLVNTLLTNLLWKTLDMFKVISRTLETVTVDEDGIHNTLS